ncbi:glycosyltransferase family 2 protein [Laetiporus sulphureus 93-53]|uniref:Glycosyltransferase family 2 protein n=1 Tax=Laetiporus sulphureus 93-53 TaxID=1314785 RepID=A0A165I726_9APHY|nr:glycosyltransferase family 2 protein [Laetiporus sulphureus 93-53]KZT12678.1 glycosyltransferase family 2 protein [Laetiporus sulphureus 93-53]
MPSRKNDLILVTGGNGFIGAHVANRLAGGGHRVRVVDINPRRYIEASSGIDIMIGNLCDPTFCSRAINGVKIVLHFAATMGGMGVIHSANDSTIYNENHTMLINVLSASLSAGVARFLYASSACVYPDTLQEVGNVDVSLRESDVYANMPPKPQGLYGLEKLHAEHVLQQYTSRMEVRIARFHNIFGPGGCWRGGHEKVPAALLRKALAAQRIDDFPADIELWGDGSQRRSFCFIDDAVEAIVRLLWSECREPVNVGCDHAVTIQELAEMAIRCAGLKPEQVRYSYVLDRPVGVGSRNSNNELIQERLRWTPTTSLEEGMTRTWRWIADEADQMLATLEGSELSLTLERLRRSEKVDLQTEAHTFAILLPITSRGSSHREDCLDNLRNFARSLLSTTAYDIGRLGMRYHLRIYLAIDHDDVFLLGDRPGGVNRAESMLRTEGISQIDTLICDHPRGHVCALWRDCAQRAWEDGCEYFTLMGDDVTVQDPNWMSAIVDVFADIAAQEHVPDGFGCVAFTDTSFPGMPTFPVLNRIHMDIFGGQVIPAVFINQDGDPFLYQLYRRWGCSRMIPSRINNKVGGSEDARYEKASAADWTFGPLDEATSTVEAWLRSRNPNVERKLALDVIIPCYRVTLTFMDRFLALQPSSTCVVMFIVIIDDPLSPNISELVRRYGSRPDVRIRVNAANLGASASRNRGLRESAAEFVLFLDDDVTPKENILIEAEKVIRAHPEAAGFVGNALFPVADTIATAAIHLAGVTYFWDIASKRADDTDLPWGVTANLIARRNVADGIEYDIGFPKTGGGEDIDYCRRKRDYSISHGGDGFHAAPSVIVTHPWWNLGRRSYWRFYLWSKGDGGLIARYPEFSYRETVPNSAELLACCVALAMGGLASSLFPATANYSIGVAYFGVRMILALFMANILHDLYRHIWRNADRVAQIDTTVTGMRKIAAIVESSIIRIFSEFGRLIGMIERREFRNIGMSFDWFTNRAGDGPRKEETLNRLQRVGLWLFLVTLAISFE